jgi:predicted PurR-regulated permease PerM
LRRQPSDAERRTLTLLLAGVTAALAWVLLPFYGVILWAGVIALLFVPLFRWLLPRLRRRRTLAALLTLAVVLLIVILPLVSLSAALAAEASTIYDRIQSGEWKPTIYLRGVFNALPDWLDGLLNRLGVANFDVLQRRLTAAAQQGTQFIATQAFTLGQNTVELLTSVVVTLYLAFFLIRDGDRVVLALRRAIPLAPQDQQELVDKFGTVIRATVKGNLLVGAVQGALGGLAFWFLGVGGALLWGVLMAFLSLLPAVGAALVWVPVAVVLFFTGAVWQAVALTLWGVFVIGLIDNLLRPVLVGKDTRLPDYIVMLTTLGGMAVFGINGFVIGPAIAAMFMAAWHIHGVHRAAENVDS